LLAINKVIPQFSFTVLKQNKIVFETLTFIEFLHHVYNIVKPFKENYNIVYGKLSIVPGSNYYKFRRKNKKYFV